MKITSYLRSKKKGCTGGGGVHSLSHGTVAQCGFKENVAK